MRYGFRFSWFSIFWILLLLMILQKNPTMALVFLILYIFYNYLRRKKSAERILASEIDKANRTLKSMHSISASLRDISKRLTVLNGSNDNARAGSGEDVSGSPFEDEIGSDAMEEHEPIEMRSTH